MKNNSTPCSTINAFWQISESLLLERCLQDIFQLIVSVTAKLLDLKLCSLMIIDEERKELHTSAVYGAGLYFTDTSSVIMKMWEGLAGRVIRERKPMEVFDIQKEERGRFPEITRTEGLVSLISVPIHIGKRVLGVLNSYTSERHSFTEKEITLLKTLANQAAQAIQNRRWRDENELAQTERENRKVIDQAKALLIEKKNLKEEEAYNLLRRSSRQYKKPMAEMAKAVILAFSFDEEKAQAELI